MPTLYSVLQAIHAPQPSPRRVPNTHPRSEEAVTSLLAVGIRQPRYAKSARQFEGTEARPRRVVVVGAGLAGLCAAYELAGLGFDVKVYEVRDRVGGRVLSVDQLVPNKMMEGGAELIGANHPLWLSYRQHFGLHFTRAAEYGNAPVRIGRKTLTFEESKQLHDEMDMVLGLLTELAETIVDPFEPWTNQDASELDHRTLADWLTRTKGTARAKAAIANMLAADNGIPAAEQSLLGVLAMIKGGGLGRYWSDTELFRCREGSQALAWQFERRLNSDGRRVFTRARVLAVARDGDVPRVKVSIDGAAQIIEADDVVLATPPSVWPRIRFADPALRKLLRTPPRLGANTKYLMRLRRRFWQDFASSPTLSSDGPVDLTWETTESNATPEFGWVAFSGAAHAKKCSRWPPKLVHARFLEALAVPYPGISQATRRGLFMNWPQDPWTRGAYYFPRPSEVTHWGPIWKDGYQGWLHFAGEHTCFAFVGYMEGALNSGFRVAHRLSLRRP